MGPVGGNAGRRLGSKLCLPSSGVGGSPRARQPVVGQTWLGAHTVAWAAHSRFPRAFVVTIRRLPWLPCPCPWLHRGAGASPWGPSEPRVPGRGHEPVAMVTTTWPSIVAVPRSIPSAFPAPVGGPLWESCLRVCSVAAPAAPSPPPQVAQGPGAAVWSLRTILVWERLTFPVFFVNNHVIFLL